MYAYFKSLEDFNLWHEGIKEELGIPDNLGTAEYTTPVVKDGEVIAFIDQRSHADLIVLSLDEVISRGFIKEDYRV